MAAKNASPYVATVKVDGVEKKITFKPFSQAPRGIFRRNRKDQEAGMWELFEWALSEADLEVFDLLPMDELEDQFTAWQDASQVTVGESTAEASDE